MIHEGSLDPVMRDVRSFWGWRERLLRTIRRWDGPVTAYDLFDALEIEHNSDDGCAAQKALERLVADGLVCREPVRLFGHVQIHFGSNQGAKYEYSAAVSP